MKSEVVSFRKKVLAGENVILKERVKSDGSVSEVRVRFYPGSELSLQVKPFVKHKGSRDEDFFTYAEGTDQFLSGDNDSFVFPVTVGVQYDDEICVYVNNTGAYEYSLVVDILLQYFADEGEYVQ